MAAINGRKDVVSLLIPHSEPKARHSEALCLAAEQGHWDVSDPKDALWYLKKQGFAREVFLPIEERLLVDEADEMRAELNSELRNVLDGKPKNARKQKM